jgi:hypothetical protein
LLFSIALPPRLENGDHLARVHCWTEVRDPTQSANALSQSEQQFYDVSSCIEAADGKICIDQEAIREIGNICRVTRSASLHSNLSFLVLHRDATLTRASFHPTSYPIFFFSAMTIRTTDGRIWRAILHRLASVRQGDLQASPSWSANDEACQ